MQGGAGEPGVPQLARRALLVCSWMYRMVKVRHPLLESLIPWEVPTLHIHICTAPPPAPPNLFPLLSPWLLAGDSQMVAHECQGPPFLGRQQRGTAHGLCTQGLAEQGRGHGAWSGYNLGTINRGSKGSCFLFSFYPLQCLC